MTRPSIALALIVKNERHNLPALFASIANCFDKVYVTDTGSTDGTLDYLKSEEAVGLTGCPIEIHHFDWVQDFAKARQASFDVVKESYVMWMDGDDALSSKEAFIQWRDEVLHIADYWLCTYQYAFDAVTGKPVCSFVRERVMKTGLGLRWKYFVHEGIPPILPDGKQVVAQQYATTWSVIHRRTAQDLNADRSRNLKMFDFHKDNLDARMLYYYGKELFENQKAKEAYAVLYKAMGSTELEAHDRILCTQYAAMSALVCEEWETAISIAHVGLQLAPQRAEFYVVMGDAYLKMNRLQDALPNFMAASVCAFVPSSSSMQNPIFNHEDSYTFYPRHQMARIYVHMGHNDKALAVIEECIKLGAHPDNEKLKIDIEQVKKMSTIPQSSVIQKSDDIVISCHPVGFYEWDEEIYKTRGVGGSETAVIRMARELHRVTGRRVLVFNNREVTRVKDGVEYRPARELPHYMMENMPRVHVAWRHNLKLTEAPTYVWCHDLMIPGIDRQDHYKAVLALSSFHEKYLSSIFGVPKDKIIVTRNGIDPERFKLEDTAVKNPMKVVYASSPDRGLDRTLLVMDKVIEKCPKAKLHIYYGFDNMFKNGMGHEAKRLQGMVDERTYVVQHGNLTQKELARELASASVWLYPTNFMETFCITALEMLASRVYPVVRKWGALENTLFEAGRDGMADLIERDCVTAEDVSVYAGAVVEAIEKMKFTNIQFNASQYSWESVAAEWVNFMGLKE